jgi:hypothetical protein
VLHSLAKNQVDCSAIALELGKVAVAATFQQFYGADPLSVTPAQVLRAADLVWHCYHSWGEVAGSVRDTGAELTVTGGITDRVLCAATAGLLTGMIARAGGISIGVEHTTCRGEGNQVCSFRLRWKVVDSGTAATVLL